MNKALSQVHKRIQPPPRLKLLTARSLDIIPQLKSLSAQRLHEMRIVSAVLPFRVNDYVINSLIDWDRVPDDPIFKLTFPQRGMLSKKHYDSVEKAVKSGNRERIDGAVREVRMQLNPHPAGQIAHNTPAVADGPLEGLQHKYNETVLYFPSAGQSCHSFCTFCFRWAQFVGESSLRIASRDPEDLFTYLRLHPEVTDVLITGGDPMTMKTVHLEKIIMPLLQSEFDHIRTVRIGSKSLAFWPYRFTTDSDADDLLRLFDTVSRSGKHLAFMAHYNHYRELETDAARRAISRVRSTGAQIRSQGPLLAHINDDPQVWSRLWQTQVGLGIVPYYMFVERDTGAREYFSVPLAKTWEIYRDAVRNVSGLSRTVRGPSMSAWPGKVEIQGVTSINGKRLFVLRMIQGRDSEWVQRPFFAEYDPRATWLNHLRPAFGEEKFFYES